MYQSLILSKSLPCLKCEQLYQRFASPPASGPSLPLDFLSYLALLHIPPWAHPLCNRAIARVYPFPCCFWLPTHLWGPSWTSPTPAGGVVGGALWCCSCSFRDFIHHYRPSGIFCVALHTWHVFPAGLWAGWEKERLSFIFISPVTPMKSLCTE